MGFWEWIPGTKAYRQRVAETTEAQAVFRNALEQSHLKELDMRNATEAMRKSRMEFKQARREAEKQDARRTGT
jgi:hypothetical protein